MKLINKITRYIKKDKLKELTKLLSESDPVEVKAVLNQTVGSGFFKPLNYTDNAKIVRTLIRFGAEKDLKGGSFTPLEFTVCMNHNYHKGDVESEIRDLKKAAVLIKAGASMILSQEPKLPAMQFLIEMERSRQSIETIKRLRLKKKSLSSLPPIPEPPPPTWKVLRQAIRMTK